MVRCLVGRRSLWRITHEDVYCRQYLLRVRELRPSIKAAVLSNCSSIACTNIINMVLFEVRSPPIADSPYSDHPKTYCCCSYHPDEPTGALHLLFCKWIRDRSRVSHLSSSPQQTRNDDLTLRYPTGCILRSSRACSSICATQTLRHCSEIKNLDLPR